MKTSRVTILACLAILGSLLATRVAIAVGSLVTGQDRNTRPACTALSGQRGRIWHEEAAAGSSDATTQCLKDASDVYAWNAIKSSAFASTDNALARFDGTSGGLQNGQTIENDAGGLTLASSMTLTGDANISDDLFVSDDATIGDDLTFGSASGVTTFTTEHIWKDAAANIMATLADLGTTAWLLINGLQIGCSDGRICNPDAVGDFIELNSGLELRVETGKSIIHYSNGVERFRAADGGVTVGAGATAITAVWRGTASIDFGAAANVSCQTASITVTGADVGDPAFVGISATIDGDTSVTGSVLATDAVQVKACCNDTTGCADPAAQTITAVVFDY